MTTAPLKKSSQEIEMENIPLADDQTTEESGLVNLDLQSLKPAKPLPAHPPCYNGPLLARNEAKNGGGERGKLIATVLELQNTLEDLAGRVDNVKEESMKLRSENQVLGQYITNLMSASSVFQPSSKGTGINTK